MNFISRKVNKRCVSCIIPIVAYEYDVVEAEAEAEAGAGS
jgi:hypothetical protein